MSQSSKEIGDKGEEIAAELLVEKGYEIVERNYRFGKGEIDIIAKTPDKKYLVFVEVKSRKNLEFGEPEYAVTKNKMGQLRRIASAYIYENVPEDIDFRMDVVAILFRQNKKPLIEHYENAF
jgi:putative endonuclease